MGRGRVQMKLIEKQSRRKCVYRNRLSCLKKKARELSELCDVPAMIISVDLDRKVDTFPENKEDVFAILNKYNLVSNKDPEKCKQNSERVEQSQITKKQLELNLLKLDNEEAVNPFDYKLVELVTTAESALCNNALYGDIMCHETDDLLVEDYLHGIEDSSVEHSHGGEDLSAENYLHGEENFSVQDDWQAEESAQLNDVLSDDIACLLDESNT